MDRDFFVFLQLLGIMIPILAAEGLFDKIPHLVVKRRQQQRALCKLLSDEPIVFDGRMNLDELSNILSDRSCSPVFFCLNGEKGSDSLNRFVDQVFTTPNLRSLPIIVSSGLFADPIVCDLHTIIIDEVDIRSFERLDLDCIPDYEGIRTIFQMLDKEEAKQSSTLIYYTLMVYREYLKKKGATEGEATEIIDALYKNYGSGIYTDYFHDFCEEFKYLFNRWRKTYGRTVDVMIPIGSDPYEIKNGVFCDGRYLYLSKATLDGVIGPMLGETRRRDILMALSREEILVRGNSDDYVYHMRYSRNGDRKTASMYRFDLSRIEDGGENYE